MPAITRAIGMTKLCRALYKGTARGCSWPRSSPDPAPKISARSGELTGAQVIRRVRGAGDKYRPEDAKTRFAPQENTRFFAPHGWIEAEYLDLFLEAPRLGRDNLSGKALRGAMRFMPRRLRHGLERGLGVVRLARV
jgi:hypothetical protein